MTATFLVSRDAADALANEDVGTNEDVGANDRSHEPAAAAARRANGSTSARARLDESAARANASVIGVLASRVDRGRASRSVNASSRRLERESTHPHSTTSDARVVVDRDGDDRGVDVGIDDIARSAASGRPARVAGGRRETRRGVGGCVGKSIDARRRRRARDDERTGDGHEIDARDALGAGSCPVRVHDGGEQGDAGTRAHEFAISRRENDDDVSRDAEDWCGGRRVERGAEIGVRVGQVRGGVRVGVVAEEDVEGKV